jgi:Ring finger domain
VPRNPTTQRHQERLRRAVALFKDKYARKLTASDCQRMHRTVVEGVVNDNEVPTCRWRFPTLPVRENDGCSVRLLSDPCAVCLQQYQVGDTVVWSPNDECRHVFHRRCLLRWLIHQTSDSDFPCAVCRQPYCREIARPSSEVPGRVCALK